MQADHTPDMFDPFFRWSESRAVSVWINPSPSLFGFPGIVAAHTIGLGLLAGDARSRSSARVCHAAAMAGFAR
jgi:hypothetical protein